MRTPLTLNSVCYNSTKSQFQKGANMSAPWGKIMADQKAKEYEIKLYNLQKRVNKAIELLQKDEPDIESVISILRPQKDSD